MRAVAPQGMADAMFVEVQRADTKATALCGVTGGLLAVVAGTALSTPVGSSWMLGVALALVGALLGAALVLALRALRPVFPKDDRLVWQGSLLRQGSACVHAPTAFVLCRVSSAEGRPCEAERLALLTALARRKFRAISGSVDLTVAALGVAGLGLLLVFLMS
ncbi:hypothetical protein CGZ69_00155 [Streptomyces peucetius subsp. caesius ATCC 27952]|nr:hypothetical protein CGZ69_00155 [Streptomyces peucetius subsp. caesius ATCC 27952]